MGQKLCFFHIFLSSGWWLYWKFFLLYTHAYPFFDHAVTFSMPDTPCEQYFNIPLGTNWPETGNTNVHFIHLFRSFSSFFCYKYKSPYPRPSTMAMEIRLSKKYCHPGFRNRVGRRDGWLESLLESHQGIHIYYYWSEVIVNETCLQRTDEFLGRERAGQEMLSF